jgi:hypothetical protein
VEIDPESDEFLDLVEIALSYLVVDPDGDILNGCLAPHRCHDAAMRIAATLLGRHERSFTDELIEAMSKPVCTQCIDEGLLRLRQLPSPLWRCPHVT